MGLTKVILWRLDLIYEELSQDLCYNRNRTLALVYHAGGNLKPNTTATASFKVLNNPLLDND